MIKACRVFLMDFGGSPWAEQLREILIASAEPSFDIRRQTGGDADLPSWTKSPGPLFAAYRPTLIFLVLAHPPALAILESLLPRLREHGRGRPVIVVTEAHVPRELALCFEHGATDVWIPPLKPVEVLAHASHWAEQFSEDEGDTAQELKKRLGLEQLVGESPVLLAVIQRIPRIAHCNLSVLIQGETGTGKEICAQAIHHLSRRSDHPFAALNCGALPAELVENELFGHESGAYTSANGPAAGLVAQADGGTLFLDEIDALASSAQVKLLRFLQDKQYRPLGAQKTHTADLRVIAATNTDLKAAVEAGHFRSDFYYRLTGAGLVLPPLRERERDVELLARHFLARYASEMNKPLAGFAAAALRKLRAYPWPGNVRELENVIAHAVLFADGSFIEPEDLELPSVLSNMSAVSFKARKAEAVKAFELRYLTDVLQAHHGNITKAARAAGKERRTFWQLLRRHGLTATRREASPR